MRRQFWLVATLVAVVVALGCGDKEKPRSEKGATDPGKATGMPDDERPPPPPPPPPVTPKKKTPQ